MKITKIIKVNVETEIQGIPAIITTEYKENENPTSLECSISGQRLNVESINMRVLLNILSNHVQVSTSDNIPVGFIQVVELEMIKVYDFIMLEINSKK